MSPIKGITNLYRPIRSGKIHLGVKLKKGTASEHPSEVDFFVLRDAPELIPFYGPDPEDPKNPDGVHLSLNVALPSARFEGENFDQYLDKVFPQHLKRYRQVGLICKGDAETALCVNEDTGTMEEQPCPCEYFDKGECKRIGILRIRVQEVASLGSYQITTSSFNSIVNINSFIRDLCEFCIVNRIDVSQVKLLLKRTETEVQRIEKGKLKKSRHHIMSLDLDPRFYKSLDDVRVKALRSTLPPAPKALPAPDETKDDLFFQEAERAGDVYSEEQKKFMKTDLNNVLSPTGGFIGSGGADDKKDAIAASAITGKKVTTEEIKKMRSEQKTSGIHDLGTEQGFPEGPPNGEPMKLTSEESKKGKPKPPDEKTPLRKAFAEFVKVGGIVSREEYDTFGRSMTKEKIAYWVKVLNDRAADLKRIAKG